MKCSINRLCNYLECSRSGYYNWINLGRPTHNPLDKIKVEKIIEIYSKDKTKGRRRIMMDINVIPGMHMCLGSIHHYMKTLGLRSIIRRRKVRAKSHEVIEKEKSLYQYENVLDRDFKANRPNQKWVTDITYMHSKDGIEYLSAIKDLYDKSIVSYFISNKNDNDLVINTLLKAFENIEYKNLNELIIHSDKGTQYTSKIYHDLLDLYGIQGSHSRKGTPHDNACAESFFSTFKSECLKVNKGRTKQMTRHLAESWIDYYNNERMQYNLKALTPHQMRCQRS